MKLHAVILAGGHGKRLWPLSTAEHPKQLLKLLDGTTLLEQTINRLDGLCTPKEITIITQKKYSHAIQEVPSLCTYHLVCEPCGRNTAPALISFLSQTSLDDETILLMVPADHFIPDAEYLRTILLRAAEYAVHNQKLVLVGIEPTHAATGYGYISTKTTRDKPYPVTQFHEKPNKEIAEKYVTQKNIFWNSGMCIGRLDVFKKELMKHQPTLYARVSETLHTPLSYAQLPSLSLDYALLEKSNKISLFPFSGEWYDVGNLNTLLMLEQRYGNHQTKLLEMAGENNIALSNKQVVCIGVNELRIVETDDHILICHQNNVEQVKEINEYRKKKSKDLSYP